MGREFPALPSNPTAVGQRRCSAEMDADGWRRVDGSDDGCHISDDSGTVVMAIAWRWDPSFSQAKTKQRWAGPLSISLSEEKGERGGVPGPGGGGEY